MTSFPEGVAGTSSAPHTHPLILVTSDCHEEGHKPSQPHFQPRIRLLHFLAHSKKPDSPMIASEPKPLHEDRPVSHSEIATHVTSSAKKLVEPALHPSKARPAEPPVEIPKPQRTPILADTSRHAGRVKDPVSISPSHGCGNAKRAHLYESIRQNGRTTEGFESSCFENEYHNEYSTRGSTCGSTDSSSARTDRTSSYGPLTHPKSFDVGGLSDAEAEASSFSLSLDGLSINEATMGRSEGSPASFDVQLYTDSIIHSAHEIEVAAESPRMLYGFQQLLGKRLEFLKVKTLSDGNGTASLEVVISSNTQQLGMGFADGSLFVLKRFKADQIGVKTKMRRDSWRQLNRECTAYRRIAEVSVCRRQGLEFVMTIEATLTLIDQNSTLDRGDLRSLCLLLPLMSKDLGQLIHKSDQQITIKDAQRILAQISTGIAALHSIGILHSDLKPPNVFIDARGNVKIGDFGLSYTTDTVGALRANEVYSSAKIGTRGYHLYTLPE